MNGIDYPRLSLLGDKVKAGTATKAETDEFMLILYQNGRINETQYQQYKSGQNKKTTEEIVNAALSVGAIVLIGYLLKEMFSSK